MKVVELSMPTLDGLPWLMVRGISGRLAAALDRAGVDAVQMLGANAPRGVTTGPTALPKSARAKSTITSTGVHLDVWMDEKIAFYAPFVEYGAHPKKAPIVLWRRGKKQRWEAKHRLMAWVKGKLGGDRHDAFGLALKIQKEGTKAHPFFWKTVPIVARRAEELLSRAAAEVLGD